MERAARKSTKDDKIDELSQVSSKWLFIGGGLCGIMKGEILCVEFCWNNLKKVIQYNNSTCSIVVWK